jgi:hypothetical protein
MIQKSEAGINLSSSTEGMLLQSLLVVCFQKDFFTKNAFWKMASITNSHSCGSEV